MTNDDSSLASDPRSSNFAGTVPTEQATQEISIPIHSFTAFRLMHGQADEITHVSQVVLLGSIPKIWFSQHKLGVIAKLTNQSLRGIKHGVKTSIYKGMSYDSKETGMLKKLKAVFNERYVNSSEDTIEGTDIETDSSSSIFQLDNGNSIHADIEDANFRLEDRYHNGTVIIGDEGVSQRVINEPSEVVNLTSILKKPSNVDNDQESGRGIQTNGKFASCETDSLLGQRGPSSISPTLTSNGSVITSGSQSVESFFTGQESFKSLNPTEDFHSSALQPDPEVHNSPNSAAPIPKIIVDEYGAMQQIPESPSQSTIMSAYSHQHRPGSKKSLQTPDKLRFSSSTSDNKNRESLLLQRPEPDSNALPKPTDSKEEQLIEKFKRLTHKKTQKFQRDPKVVNRKKIYHLLNRNYSTGEIIKAQKMLVLIKKTFQPDPSKLSNPAELENSDARVYERWKEYIVVARSSGDIDAPVRLEFISNRRELKHGHKTTDIDFNLDGSCVISFYNSLDKTILIGYHNRIYVFTCQSQTEAINWLTFLKETQGYGGSRALRISVPVLNLSMNFNLPNDVLRKFSDDSATDFVVEYKPNGGYRNTNSKLVEFMSQKIRERLIQAGYAEVSEKFRNAEYLLGFCWRHYDRLEWLYSETLSRLFWQHSMNDTHDLELRKICHYPNTLDPVLEIDGANTPLAAEPPPVEGFLSRLTTRNGNQRRGIFRKQVFKFSYLSSCNNLLFITNAYKAIPPLVYSQEMMKDIDNYVSNFDNFMKIRSSTPQIYFHNPYAVDGNSHFTWLKPDVSADEFEARDLYAQLEFERRLASVLRSESIINLLDVESINICDPHKIPKTADLANNIIWENLQNKQILSLDIDGSERSIFFQIELKNGSRMILMAPNSFVRDEWVSRLTNLKNYWTARSIQDMLKIKNLKTNNIKKLDLDDWMEANINEYTEKWENSRGLTNPEIHNISSSALFRPVIRNGELYKKPKKHSTFSKAFVVLAPGQLMIYHMFSRSMSGRSIPSTHYNHNITIPLKACYVFSGNLSGMDLLSEKESEFEAHPGTNSTPRIYQDGWSSSDEEENLCFTLWFGKKRAISGSSSKKAYDYEYDENSREIIGSGRDEDSSKNPGLFHMVSRLGVTGRSFVFKCRSRQERDLWVGDLLIELDRFEALRVN